MLALTHHALLAAASGFDAHGCVAIAFAAEKEQASILHCTALYSRSELQG